MNSPTIKIVLGIMLTIMLSLPAASQDVLDRTQRPVAKAAPRVQLPEIQKTKLKNGLSVWLVENHELPIVAFNLVIQSGADHDPSNLPGLASMTADVLDEGTKTRDALQISDELESIGASLNVNSNFDGSFLSLNTVTKYLDKALAVYTDVLSNPTFPQKEFDRLKEQRLASLIQQRDQPVSIANNAYSYILYGSNHPYGNNPFGTQASIKAMTRDDLVMFYQTHYRPNNATLIVVGDAKLGDVTVKLETALQGWTSSAVSGFTVPTPSLVEKMRVYLIDKPGAPQSEVRIGYPALARSSPEFFPVLVMNRALGGQFTSRINLNLREKRGYTYGARSAFSFQKGVGPFTASGGIVSDKTDSALIEFLKEINLMQEKGMNSDELSYVKMGLIGSFALTFETPAQVAGVLQNIILYSLPEDYYAHYLQNIEGVSLADVQRVAQKYLDTKYMAVVVVGDLAKIKEGVSSLKLGDVIMCDLDGKPLP